MVEKVEMANKVAVESGHRVLSLLGQQKQQPRDQVVCRNLISQADDSVVKFKRVVSLLGNRFCVARARRGKSLSFPNLPDNLFTETSHCNPESSANKPLQLLATTTLPPKPSSETEAKSRRALQFTQTIFEDGSGIDTSLSVKPPSAEALQQILRFPRPSELQRIQQQIKHQAEMYSRSTSSGGFSLKFDGPSSCTHIMSSNRSFMSSLTLSRDGGVANLGGNSFQPSR